MTLFIRVLNKYNALEKIPVSHGTGRGLHHSERHMLDMVGDHPGVNVTEFARLAGVTKGAVSQVLKKLETKGLVRRCNSPGSKREVMIQLTEIGNDFYQAHKQVNAETLKPLMEELQRHPAENVEFLVSMFRWFDTFLDQSRQTMLRHDSKQR